MSQAVMEIRSMATDPAELGSRSVPKPRPTAAESKSRRPAAAPRLAAVATTAALGLLSALLYLMLFRYSDVLANLASQTAHGHKLYALVPIAVAFVFSLVHGSFTGRFWDLLGLKAKGK